MADQTSDGKINSRARRSGDRKLTPRGGTASAIWYVLAVFLLLALGQAFFFSMQGGESIPYSEFKQRVRDGRVSDVAVAEDRVRGTMKDAAKDTRPFTALRIEDPKLLDDLEKAGVKYKGEAANKWVGEIVGWIIPLIFLIA